MAKVDCPHCKRSFPKQKARDDHIARAHPDEDPPKDRKPLLIGGLAVLAVIVVAFMLFGGGGSAAGQFHVEDSPSKGDPDAPVQLVAFESPACTSCRLFHVPRGGEELSTLDKIEERYVDSGQLLYVEKFARAGYPWETRAAHGQKCTFHLGGADAFFDLTDRFYEQQPSLSSSNVDSFMTQWARGYTGIDANELVTCAREERYGQDITRDRGDGDGAGVLGTPSFFLVHPDGEVERLPFAGFVSFANAIEAALDKVEQPGPSQPEDPAEDQQAQANESQGNDTTRTRSAPVPGT